VDFTMTLPADVPSAGEVLKVTSYSAGAIVTEWAADNTGAGAFPLTVDTDATSTAGVQLYWDLSGTGEHFYDSAKIWLGTGTGIGAGDAEMYYDGTNLIIDADVIGTGVLKLQNAVRVTDRLTVGVDSAGAAAAMLSVFGGPIAIDNQYDIRFYESVSFAGNYWGIIPPASWAVDFTMTLPADVPSAGEVLKVTSYAAGVIVTEWGTGGGAAFPLTVDTDATSTAGVQLYWDLSGTGEHFYDSAKIWLGTGTGIGAGDAEMYYDGTNLILDPNVIGSGYLSVAGNELVSGHMGVGALGEIDSAGVSNRVALLHMEENISADNFFLCYAATSHTSTTGNAGLTSILSFTYTADASFVAGGGSVAYGIDVLMNAFETDTTLFPAIIPIRTRFKAGGNANVGDVVHIQLADLARTGTTATVSDYYGMRISDLSKTYYGTVYGIQINAFAASTTRWPFYYGNIGTSLFTIDHSGNTLIAGTLGVSVASASAPLTVTQVTLGNPVAQLISTSTNDDPTEAVYQNRRTSTDATANQTLHTFAIPTSNTVMIEVNVIAKRSTTETGAGYKLIGVYKNVAGTVTLIGAVATALSGEDVAGWDCNLAISGTNVLSRVTGAASSNITWHMTARVWQVST
jgi:hypothetical protein